MLPIKKWNKKDWWKKPLLLPTSQQIGMLYYTETILSQLRAISPSGNLWMPAIEDEVAHLLQDQFSSLPLKVDKQLLLKTLYERVLKELPLSISGGIIRCLDKIKQN